MFSRRLEDQQMFAGITANEKTDAEEIYRFLGCTVRRRINFFISIICNVRI